MCTNCLGSKLILYVRCSQFRLTNLFFVLFQQQTRLHNSECQHNSLEICNFLCLISRFSLFNLEMNGPEVVVEGCTHFPELLVWERKEKLKLVMKLGKDLKRIPHKYGHICVRFFLTPSPTSPCSATVTSTKNDLQY